MKGGKFSTIREANKAVGTLREEECIQQASERTGWRGHVTLNAQNGPKLGLPRMWLSITVNGQECGRNRSRGQTIAWSVGQSCPAETRCLMLGRVGFTTVSNLWKVKVWKVVWSCLLPLISCHVKWLFLARLSVQWARWSNFSALLVNPGNH
jgi:hypothetical protein